MEEVFGKTDISASELKRQIEYDEIVHFLDEQKIAYPKARTDYFTEKISEVIQRLPENGERFPWRETNSEYKIYISEILLQRTRGKNVEKMYSEFFRRFPDARALDRADKEEIKLQIKSLGLANRRSKCLKDVADMLSRNSYNVPGDRDKLIEPWRVGPYAADATLLFAQDISRPLIDTNVKQVAEILLSYPTNKNTEDEDFKKLCRFFTPRDEKIARAFYLAIIDFDF